MVLRTRRTIGVVVATLATGVAVVPAATNGASSQQVNATAKVKGLPSFSGTVSGRPFGRGTVKGAIDLPNLRATLRYGGGTVRIRGTVQSAAPLKGTWRVTGGSGSYAGVSGSGRFTGSFSGTRATLRFRGTVRR